MKTYTAAKLKDMAEVMASQTMLAAIATLCIRFIRAYMASWAWFNTITVTPLSICAYARKRIINRTNHERKFALFTKNPNSRAGLFGNT